MPLTDLQNEVGLILRDHFAIPQLEVIFEPLWGSENPDHRLEIRKYVQSCIWNSPTLMNVSETPDPQGISLSISHCRGMGGVFWSSNSTTPWPHRLGLDVERTDRCNPKALLRVSSQAEIEEAPDAAALWTAKEAAFKAIPRTLQPPSVSLLRVTKWVKTTRNAFWQWQILSAQNDNFGRLAGITIEHSDHKFSFCVKSFTT